MTRGPGTGDCFTLSAPPRWHAAWWAVVIALPLFAVGAVAFTALAHFGDDGSDMGNPIRTAAIIAGTVGVQSAAWRMRTAWKACDDSGVVLRLDSGGLYLGTGRRYRSWAGVASIAIQAKSEYTDGRLIVHMLRPNGRVSPAPYTQAIANSKMAVVVEAIPRCSPLVLISSTPPTFARPGHEKPVPAAADSATG